VQSNRFEERMSDEVTLVQRAIDRDANAFGRLYVMHMERVFSYIYYRVGSRADAEDLTQQVFLNAWQAIGRYRKTASPFVAWLMTIGHNLVVNFYHTRKDKVSLDAEMLADDSAPDPELTAEAGFERQRLRRAILQLRADEQQVITLRFMEGFAFAEIASVMKKKEGNTRVIMHRALAKLRDIMEKEGEQS